MSEVEIEVRVLGPEGATVLDRVADGVFDNAVDVALAGEFLTDSRHHLAVAVEDGVVVGMASAVDYVHPDKPRELWINEVGVATSHRGRGVATRLLQALFERGRQRGCREAWVLTNRSNGPALQLYRSAGGVRGESDTVMFTFRLDGGS